MTMELIRLFIEYVAAGICAAAIMWLYITVLLWRWK